MPAFNHTFMVSLHITVIKSVETIVSSEGNVNSHVLYLCAL